MGNPGPSADAWPYWPEDRKGQNLVDVHVSKPVDELWNLLFGPASKYTAKAQEVRQNREYVETPWLPEGEVEAAFARATGSGGGPQSNGHGPVANGNGANGINGARLFKGKARMTRCFGAAMGLKFKSEELQRCIEAEEGKQYVVEVCVSTTATYGDKFRCICKHKLVALGPEKSSWTVDFALVYIASVNGLLKKAIERGASGGVKQNFEALVGLLGTFAEVAPAAGAAPAPPQPVAGAPIIEKGPRWLVGIVEEELVSLVEPVAAKLKTLLRVGGSQPPDGSRSRTALALAILALVLAVAMLHALISSIGSICQVIPSGRVYGVCRTVGQWVHFPGSLLEIFWAIALAWGASIGVTAGVRFVNTRASAWARARRATRRVSSLAECRSDQDMPLKGRRYSGWSEALQSAESSILRGEEELHRQPPTVPVPKGARSSSQLKSSLQYMKRAMEDTWKVTYETVVPGPKPGDVVTLAPSGRPAAYSVGTGSARAPPPPAPALSSVRPRSTGATGVTGVTATTLPSVVGRPPVGPPSPIKGGDAVVEASARSATVTKAMQRKGANSGTMSRSKDIVGSMGSVRSAASSQEGSPVKDSHLAVQGSSPSLAQTFDSGWVGSSYASLASLDQRSAASLDQSSAPIQPEPGSVEEEVFENERLQPFRGWGHQWPGHFLPTDRVGHWSRRDDSPGGTASMSFHTVEPPVPEGWVWLEDDWAIDISGLQEGAVDGEGWTYGVDFNWVTWPPQPGAGAPRLMRDFVRKRRWVRTRVRVGGRAVPPALSSYRLSLPVPVDDGTEDTESTNEDFKDASEDADILAADQALEASREAVTAADALLSSSNIDRSDHASAAGEARGSGLSMYHSSHSTLTEPDALAQEPTDSRAVYTPFAGAAHRRGDSFAQAASFAPSSADLLPAISGVSTASNTSSDRASLRGGQPVGSSITCVEPKQAIPPRSATPPATLTPSSSGTLARGIPVPPQRTSLAYTPSGQYDEFSSSSNMQRPTDSLLAAIARSPIRTLQSDSASSSSLERGTPSAESLGDTLSNLSLDHPKSASFASSLGNEGGSSASLTGAMSGLDAPVRASASFSSSHGAEDTSMSQTLGYDPQSAAAPSTLPGDTSPQAGGTEDAVRGGLSHEGQAVTEDFAAGDSAGSGSGVGRPPGATDPQACQGEEETGLEEQGCGAQPPIEIVAKGAEPARLRGGDTAQGTAAEPAGPPSTVETTTAGRGGGAAPHKIAGNPAAALVGSAAALSVPAVDANPGCELDMPVQPSARLSENSHQPQSSATLPNDRASPGSTSEIFAVGRNPPRTGASGGSPSGNSQPLAITPHRTAPQQGSIFGAAPTCPPSTAFSPLRAAAGGLSSGGTMARFSPGPSIPLGLESAGTAGLPETGERGAPMVSPEHLDIESAMRSAVSDLMHGGSAGTRASAGQTHLNPDVDSGEASAHVDQRVDRGGASASGGLDAATESTAGPLPLTLTAHPLGKDPASDVTALSSSQSVEVLDLPYASEEAESVPVAIHTQGEKPAGPGSERGGSLTLETRSPAGDVSNLEGGAPELKPPHAGTPLHEEAESMEMPAAVVRGVTESGESGAPAFEHDFETVEAEPGSPGSHAGSSWGGSWGGDWADETATNQATAVQRAAAVQPSVGPALHNDAGEKSSGLAKAPRNQRAIPGTTPGVEYQVVGHGDAAGAASSILGQAGAKNLGRATQDLNLKPPGPGAKADLELAGTQGGTPSSAPQAVVPDRASSPAFAASHEPAEEVPQRAADGPVHALQPLSDTSERPKQAGFASEAGSLQVPESSTLDGDHPVLSSHSGTPGVSLDGENARAGTKGVGLDQIRGDDGEVRPPVPILAVVGPDMAMAGVDQGDMLKQGLNKLEATAKSGLQSLKAAMDDFKGRTNLLSPPRNRSSGMFGLLSPGRSNSGGSMVSQATIYTQADTEPLPNEAIFLAPPSRAVPRGPLRATPSNPTATPRAAGQPTAATPSAVSLRNLPRAPGNYLKDVDGRPGSAGGLGLEGSTPVAATPALRSMSGDVISHWGSSMLSRLQEIKQKHFSSDGSGASSDGSPQHSKMSAFTTAFSPPTLNRFSTGAGAGPFASDREAGVSRDGTGHLLSPGDSRRASSDGGLGLPAVNGAGTILGNGTGRRFSTSDTAESLGSNGLGFSQTTARSTPGTDTVDVSSSRSVQTSTANAGVASRGKSAGGFLKKAVKSPLGSAPDPSTGSTGRVPSGDVSGALLGNPGGASSCSDMGHVNFSNPSSDTVKPPRAGFVPRQGGGAGSNPGPVDSVGVAGRVGPPSGRRVADQTPGLRRPSATEEAIVDGIKGRDKSA